MAGNQSLNLSYETFMLFVRKTILVVFSWIVLISNTSNASEEIYMEISFSNTRIKIGDPLFAQIKHRYKTSYVDVNTNKGVERYILHFIRFRVNKLDSVSKIYKLTPSVVMFKDEENETSFSGVVEIHFDEHGLIFVEPGVYEICWISPDEKEISNIIQIEVKGLTKEEKKALDTLKHPDDYIFLQSGYCINGTKAAVMSRLEKYIERDPNTILNKRIKVRIGLENLKELKKRYGDLDEFNKTIQQETAKDPLTDKVIQNLNLALELSNDFPSRQEVLYHLAILEYIKNNDKKSFSLLEKSIRKYPMSEYGKKAKKMKDYLERRKKEEN